DGDPIKTETGEGLGGADDGKEAAEGAAEEAKKKAEEALHGLDGDQDGKPDGLLGEDDGDRDTLKVKQGDKTFEMTEPDHDGKMDIKVGDGPGDPKDFKLDWSTDGPQGTDDGCYRPGDDGKIHIEDGDLKITAERPDGPEGPTVVTVDDGSGTPTTYTLGEDDKPSDALGDTPGKRDDDLPTHRGTLEDLGTATDGSGAHHSPDGSPGGDSPGQHGGGDGSHGGGDGGAGSHHGGSGAAGFGGGAHGGPSTAGFDPSGAGLGDTPTSGGAHTGVGLAQPQPAAAAFAPAGATAGTGGQPTSGMPGMGAMGGGAHGGGGGGDTERRSSAYRIDGAVFDNLGEPGRRIIGSLNDDEDPASARTW
ncbi:hypothetical protein CF165_22165, partial [Amycolatopsis vastitatis]